MRTTHQASGPSLGFSGRSATRYNEAFFVHATTATSSASSVGTRNPLSVCISEASNDSKARLIPTRCSRCARSNAPSAAREARSHSRTGPRQHMKTARCSRGSKTSGGNSGRAIGHRVRRRNWASNARRGPFPGRRALRRVTNRGLDPLDGCTGVSEIIEVGAAVATGRRAVPAADPEEHRANDEGPGL